MILYNQTYIESLCQNDTSTSTSSVTFDSDNSNSTVSFYCTESEDEEETSDVLSVRLNCDFDPPAERDLYLAVDECFLLSNQTKTTQNESTIQTIYAQINCGVDSFITTFYESEGCSDSALTETRELSMSDCTTWLYQNETGFDFDIQASVPLFLFI